MRDLMGAVNDFLDPVIDRIAMPRRIADAHPPDHVHGPAHPGREDRTLRAHRALPARARRRGARRSPRAARARARSRRCAARRCRAVPPTRERRPSAFPRHARALGSSRPTACAGGVASLRRTGVLCSAPCQRSLSAGSAPSHFVARTDVRASVGVGRRQPRPGAQTSGRRQASAPAPAHPCVPRVTLPRRRPSSSRSAHGSLRGARPSSNSPPPAG